jgi:hypothetical protein
MKNIKYILSLLLPVLIALPAGAQSTSPFRVHSGFGDFILNAEKNSLGIEIRFTDSMTYKGVKEYSYYHPFPAPLNINGVEFPGVILDFDAFYKIKQIALTKIYTKRLYPDPKVKALLEKEALTRFLSQQTGKKGKRKTKFNSLDADGYEWRKGNIATWLYLQTTAALNSNSGEFYSISIIWTYKETGR